MQGYRKHLKSGRGGGRSKKGHMATPLNSQNSKRFENIPNQVRTVIGWELKIINLRVYLKNCYLIQKISKIEWKIGMPKFPSKVKVIDIKIKVIILWIWKGHFLDFEGALLPSFAKKWGAMVPLGPRFLRPCPYVELHTKLGLISLYMYECWA